MTSGMREAGGFASLTSGLLARKGHATPAMRRQSLDLHPPIEDLGWNDMGADAAPLPEVLRQQAELGAALSASPAADEALLPMAEVARIADTLAVAGPKSAFTLRLTPNRHLRLRLACTIRRKSAQALVTDALETYLATLPEIAALAGQVMTPPTSVRRTQEGIR